MPAKPQAAGLTKDLAMHILELPKFQLTAEQLSSPLEIWLYFLLYADKLDMDALPPTLDTPMIRLAMEELKMVSQNDLERERYEARIKGQRDARSDLLATRKEALAQGRAEGLEEGRAEVLIQMIHFAQQVLKRPLTPAEQLSTLSVDELQRLADQLKQETLP